MPLICTCIAITYYNFYDIATQDKDEWAPIHVSIDITQMLFLFYFIELIMQQLRKLSSLIHH